MAEEISDVAAFRLHVINYYYKYGIRQTMDAFKIKKSTFHEWKRTYEKSGKRTISLVPHQTRPLHVRKMQETQDKEISSCYQARIYPDGFCGGIYQL